MTTLSFVRATALLRNTFPTQNAAGEMLNSYTAIGTVTGQLDPNKGGIQRLIGGQVVEAAYLFYVQGSPDLQELDRSTVEGRRVEIVAVNQWGNDHAEVLLRYLGR